MKLVFTDNFSVPTTGIVIKKGSIPGNGIIPNSISWSTVIVEPVSETDTIEVGGICIDKGSAMIVMRAGDGYQVDGLTSDDHQALLVAGHGRDISVNLSVFGKE